MADIIILAIPSIPGTTQVTGFSNGIECTNFNHGVSMQVTRDTSNSERTSGKPDHRDFTLTKYLDQATPLLNQNCCMGQNLGTTTITIGRNDKGAFLPLIVYTLYNTVISSVSVGGGGMGKPTETVSLNYSAIGWQYTVQQETGGQEGQVPGSWNVATNATALPS